MVNITRYLFLFVLLGALINEAALLEGTKQIELAKEGYNIGDEKNYLIKGISLMGLGSLEILEGALIYGYGIGETLPWIKTMPELLKYLMFIIFFITPSTLIAVPYYSLVKLKILKEPGYHYAQR